MAKHSSSPFISKFILLMVIVLCGLGAWFLFPKDKSTMPHKNPSIPLLEASAPMQAASSVAPSIASEVVASSAPAFQEKAVFSCIIEPIQTVEIRSAITATINQIRVGRGDTVQKGQTLVVLNSKITESSSKSAKQRAQANAQIEGGRKKLAAAETKVKRIKQMYKHNFVSKQALDDAINERNIAEAELNHAIEMQKIAQADYRTSTEELALRTIKSPFNGIVTARYADVGSIANPTDTKNPILKLAQIEQLKLTAILPFKYFNQIQNGDQMTIIPEAPFDTPISVIVNKKDQVIDAASGTFGVIAIINNASNKLPAGIMCQVDLDN